MREIFRVSAQQIFNPEDSFSLAILVKFLDAWPGNFKRDLEAAGNADGGVVLKGHAISAGCLARRFHAFETACYVLEADVDGDDNLARAALRPPDEVAVVPADGFR